MSKDTGGPAFPSKKEHTTKEGMTLRDYFAAKAMEADMSTYSQDLIYESPEWFVARAKKWYEVADAMLRAREAT
jgi:hypothetical protein